MARIRIAQRAWEGTSAVDEIGPNTTGLDLMWIEIDGFRIDRSQVSASIKASDSGEGYMTLPEITLRIVGTVEVVYLSKRGEPIASVHADPRDLIGSEYGAGGANPFPPPADTFKAIEERDEARAEVNRLRERLGWEPIKIS